MMPKGNVDINRALSSYSSRFYVIKKWDDDVMGWVEVEYMPANVCEQYMLQDMHNKYDHKLGDYRLFQVILSDITYEVEENK